MTRRLYEDEADIGFGFPCGYRLKTLIVYYYLYIVLLNTIVFDYLGMYISSESSVIAVLDYISCYDKHIVY